MRICIIGGAGFLGQKLARALTAKGTLKGKQITRLVLADMVAPATVDADFDVATTTVDITDPIGLSSAVVGADVVYHLAAIVSAQAEAEFVFDLVRHDDRFWIKHSYGINGPYFGLYQAEGAREPLGGWTWVTGEPLDYAPWNPGQPNNSNNNQHWGHFTHRPGNHTPNDPVEPANFWTDSDQRIRRSFVIEIE